MSSRALALGTSLFLLLVLLPRFAAAESFPGTPLLLEVWVNGQTHHRTVSVTNHNEIFFMKANDLTESGIKLNEREVPPCGLVAVNRLADIKAEIVTSEQKLLITAPPERIIPQEFDVQNMPPVNLAVSDTGFIGSYNLVATVDDFNRGDQTTNGGATLGGTIFTPNGILTATGFTQTQTGIGHVTRLDTTAEIDEPNIMRRWMVGDAVSGGLNWSRSVRFGGMQVATDFSMRPDLNTMPLPAFFGQTAVPATVDVFVNAARVFESNVDAGPFQINNLPLVTGNGQVSVVTRDILGQQTTSILPFYVNSQLLKKGLDSYDLDIGFVRNSYGETSLGYSEPVATGTYSIGTTNWLTLETHAEAAHNLQLGGGGAIFSIGTYGIAHIAAAGSTFDNEGRRQNGSLYSLSIESQHQPVGFFGSISKALGAYADIATLGSAPPPTFQTQLGANLGLENGGSLAVSWIASKSNDEDSTQLLSASYTISFGKRWNFGITSFYDLVNHASTSEAILSISLDNRMIGSSTTRLAEHDNQEEIGIVRPANTDGGLGYQLSGAAGSNTTDLADVTWINSRGTFDASYSLHDGVEAGRVTANGGFVAMGGAMYATQYPNGAVALVRTGQPNTRVYQENREVGTTDEDGEALLTNFTPFSANRIGIDPRDYDLSTTIDATQKTVVPRRQSGVIVDLAPVPHQPAILILHLESGDFPPMGAGVTFNDGSAPTVVGRHGEVYVIDLKKPLQGTVQYGNSTCHFEVTPQQRSKDNPISRLDDVKCIAVQTS